MESESNGAPELTVASAVGFVEFTVLDCPNPLELARFYRGILGGDILEDGDEWVALRTPRGGALSFQRVPEFVAPTWPTGPVPQQLHLDIQVDDIELAETAALALGATSTGYPTVSGADQHYRVYLDPVGHPFCLVY